MELAQVLKDQKAVFNAKLDVIERTINLDPFIKTSLVVVISGIRRSGKSSLMFLIKEKLKLKDEDFIYLNCDDDRLELNVSILEQIHLHHWQQYGKDPVYFLDEIQNIPNWEKFVNRQYEKGLKLYVTGSNAHLLSSEIATTLTGRNRLLELYPFSFEEFLRYRKIANYTPEITSQKIALIRKSFDEYMKIGGFPLVIKERDISLVSDYFKDILYRDIIARYRIGQINEIRTLTQYLASNIGKLFSFNRLQLITGLKSTNSIKNYLDYLSQAYIFCYLPKFDYSVDKQIRNSKKVYTIDVAFAHILGFNFSENSGRLLENVVYVELKRRACEIYYFAQKGECDFLTKSNLEITNAIQVVYSLSKTNLEREISGVQEAMDTYSIDHGLVIYYEIDPNLNLIYPKIQFVEITKWLCTNQIYKN